MAVIHKLLMCAKYLPGLVPCLIRRMCWDRRRERITCLQIIALEGKSALRIYNQNSARPLHADKNGEM